MVEADREMLKITTHWTETQEQQLPWISMETSAAVGESELYLKNYWRLTVEESEKWKFQGNPVMGGGMGGGSLLWILPPGAQPSSHRDYQRKILLYFWWRKRTKLEIHHSLCSSQGLPSRETILQELGCFLFLFFFFFFFFSAPVVLFWEGTIQNHPFYSFSPN